MLLYRFSPQNMIWIWIDITIHSDWSLEDLLGFPGVLVKRLLPTNEGQTRDVDLIPGSLRFPGVGNGIPLQRFCQKNSTGRGTWQATVLGAAKSWTRVSDWDHTHIHRTAIGIYIVRDHCPMIQHKEKSVYLVIYTTASLILLHGGKATNQYFQTSLFIEISFSCIFSHLFLTSPLVQSEIQNVFFSFWMVCFLAMQAVCLLAYENILILQAFWMVFQKGEVEVFNQKCETISPVSHFSN